MQNMKNIYLLIIFFIFFTISLRAQGKLTSLDSYKKAREIVLKGMQVLGGYENIAGIKSLSVEYKEYNSNRGQNLNPDLPNEFEEGNSAHYYFDAINGYTRYERNFQRRGRLFNPVLVYKGDEGFFYWPETEELHNSINVSLIKNLYSFRNTNLSKLLPHFILKSALGNPSSLRWQGEINWNNKVLNIVSFTYTDGSLATLYFDKDLGLIIKSEEIINDLLEGDTIGEIIYSEYKIIDGINFPRKITLNIGLQQMLVIENQSVQFNIDFNPEIFLPPAGIQPSNYPKIFVPQKLAEGVYFVPLFNATGISYNSMFVVYDNYVLVMDSPLSDQLSKFYINLINKIAPGKPIKYVVPTHYHWDHSGGIKQFVATGSHIVTTPGNEKFFRNVLSASRTLVPSAQISKENVFFDLFTDRKIIEDGPQKVELYNIGPNPHADEIIIAYLPEHKILYVSDLFWGVLTDHNPPARKTLIEFAEKIKTLGLDVKVIAPGHGKLSTIEDLEKAINS